VIALAVVLFNVFSATGEIRSFGQGLGLAADSMLSINPGGT
jgi:hypothetical protein